ncbi:MAG: NAD-dependent epimerase/dehydratase family protein [Desulforudis sp.]|nr:MAG: NAD-dependent epimerase/dehydratase family protein [Desulforudis sp.]
MDWDETEILITGGTGSLGKALTNKLLAMPHPPRGLRIYSRDELKQWQMKQDLPAAPRTDVAFLIGDVRDGPRLKRAMEGVDVVFHAAAMKHVPACENDPEEACKTNVLGAQNVINAAVDCGVKRVLNVTTDKAVAPVNLYGATKLCAEKLFIHGNIYSKGLGLHRFPRFSCCRYGNVVGSRGSVAPLFQKQARETGRVQVTDVRMTRFWITLPQVVAFLLRCVKRMEGGEIFVPKMRSMRVVDLVAAVAPGAEMEIIGIRPGEKLAECLILAEESRDTTDEGEAYVIRPSREPARRNPDLDWSYTSDRNGPYLTVEELREMLEEAPQ